MEVGKQRTVLVLDDDEVNLTILVRSVQEAGYIPKAFSGAAEALEYMLISPGEIDIALLDKMMPGMNGIDLLKRMKAANALRRIPVIMQTGDAGVEQVREGLEAGAYYYLAKPFHSNILFALLRAAASECKVQEEIARQGTEGSEIVRMMQKGDFFLRTHDQARRICAAISQLAAYPEFVVLGLMELLANAIEHGNLAIGHDRKRECLISDTWNREIATRMASPEFAQRSVRLQFEQDSGSLHVVVKDQGCGFDWQSLADRPAAPRVNQPNGHGLSRAMRMLDNVRFIGNGSEVHCTIQLPVEARTEREREAG
jgi:CheY-like chemotaxis protein